MFTVTCQYNGTIFAPDWLVTGLATLPDQEIRIGMTTGPFIYYYLVAESTLTVSSEEVREGTCFQCEISTSRGLYTSKQSCVTAAGE